VSQEAADYLSAEAFQAAKAAAAIMAMNNIYYRATHLIGDEAYATLPARLRMTVIGNPGVDKTDFELWCLAVSAINGCGTCLASHEQVLRKADVPREQIQEALRIAAEPAEPVVRRLLESDPALRELEIRRAGLADAFLALTRSTDARQEAA